MASNNYRCVAKFVAFLTCAFIGGLPSVAITTTSNPLLECAKGFGKLEEARLASGFQLGSTERPTYSGFATDFPTISDPETFYLEFQSRRVVWNKAHPANLDNMPTPELAKGLTDLEILLRQEKRPRRVIKEFLEKAAILREKKIPYNDTHALFYDVSKFFAHRHPVGNATRADEELVAFAKQVLPDDSFQTFENQFRKFHLEISSARNDTGVNLDRQLREFRLSLLKEIDNTFASVDGPAKLVELQNLELRTKSSIAQTEAKLKKLEEIRNSGAKRSIQQQNFDEQDVRFYKSELFFLQQRATQLQYAGSDRRKLFYTRAEDNRLPEDIGRHLSHIAGFRIAGPAEQVFIAGAGTASIRGLSEALLFQINPALLMRKSQMIDGNASNALAGLSHDLTHVPLMPEKLAKLPTEEKRRILNGIDSIANPAQRELAEYGLFLTLHEIVPRASNVDGWSEQAVKLRGRPLSEIDQKWLVHWMTDFQKKFGLRTRLTEEEP